MGTGINTEVTGGGGLREARERQDLLPLQFSEAQLGRLGVACLSCLTKHPAPIIPRRNPRPRALMDLGTKRAQPEMASNTGL